MHERGALFAGRRRVAALVLVVLALSAVAVARSRGQVDRARLRAGDVSASARTLAEVDPHVAMTSDGHAAVSFMGVSHGAEGDAARVIGVRTSRDYGASWGAMQELRAPDSRFSTDSMLVSDGGGFVLTWLGFHQRLARGGDPYDLEVYMARADASTGYVFGAPQKVTDGVRGEDKFLRVDKPWTTRLHDGALATSYRVESGSGAARVQVSRTTDGAHFTHATVYAGQPFGGTLATICADAASASTYVAYVDGSRGTFADVVLHASRDGARTFPAELRSVVSLADEHAVVEAPQCVASDGAVWLAYGVGSAPPDDASSAAYDALVIARSRDGGRTFDARFRVVEAGNVLLHPTFARLPSGDFEVLALVGAADGDPRGTVRRFRVAPDGSPRGPSVALQEGVRLVRKRAPLEGWTGDFMGLATAGQRALYAFGVNGGEAPGDRGAHVRVRGTTLDAGSGPSAP